LIGAAGRSAVVGGRGVVARGRDRADRGRMRPGAIAVGRVGMVVRGPSGECRWAQATGGGVGGLEGGR
jgi:hypothetical protein